LPRTNEQVTGCVRSFGHPHGRPSGGQYGPGSRAGLAALPFGSTDGSSTGRWEVPRSGGRCKGGSVATREIRIDRGKTLLEEPGTGHNRWHPDIPPVLRCEPGDEVVLETRDALDGQLGPAAGLDAVASANLDVVHPLTGPVYVEGAEPGDLLAVEIIDIEPDRYGFTVQIPGFGFLRDVF